MFGMQRSKTSADRKRKQRPIVDYFYFNDALELFCIISGFALLFPLVIISCFTVSFKVKFENTKGSSHQKE